MIEGFAQTTDADALIARAARHFAHKVPVEIAAATTRVTTRFGAFELEPSAERVFIRCWPLDAQSQQQLQELVADHLARFAREPITFNWT